MSYPLALAMMVVAYVAIIMCMKHMHNTRFWNTVFGCSVLGFYIILLTVTYRHVGFDDWNFQNMLPMANVSPFMFSVVPVILILPWFLKRYAYTLVSLLCVGMFLSFVLGCVYNTLIDYRFIPSFMLDYLAHLMISLWGVYLVRSGTVKLDRRSCIIGGSTIVVVAVSMLIANLMLGTSYFGLSFDGGHNIYNVVFTDNPYVSATVYFIGLIGVMILGYLYNRALSHLMHYPYR